jgi:hypothetical protein
MKLVNIEVLNDALHWIFQWFMEVDAFAAKQKCRGRILLHQDFKTSTLSGIATASFSEKRYSGKPGRRDSLIVTPFNRSINADKFHH